MSDQVLEWGVGAVVARCEARGQLHDEQAELLIADVHSVPIKVCTIFLISETKLLQLLAFKTCFLSM